MYSFLMKDLDFASHADGNILQIADENIDQVISVLQNAAVSPFKLFWDNHMKVNIDIPFIHSWKLQKRN